MVERTPRAGNEEPAVRREGEREAVRGRRNGRFFHRLARFPRPRFWLAGYAAWIAALLWVSSLPGGHFGFQPFQFADKFEHAIFFMVGSACLGFAAAGSDLLGGRWWWLPVLMAAIVGGFDEWYQQFAPGRSAHDFPDWLADVSGGVAGTVVVVAVLRWRRRPA